MKKKKSKKTERRNSKIRSSSSSEGIFTAAQGGFGFVDRGRGKPSIFIPPHAVGSAITGDKVKVMITDPYGANDLGPVGRIQTVLNRGKQIIVGELLPHKEIRPLDERLPGKIKISGSIRGIRLGDWVKVRLLDNGKKFTEHLRGEIVERLGETGSIAGDLKAVAEEFEMPRAYSEAENQAASKIKPQKIKREDLRGLFTVTIDPADAKDFDDAISISEGKEKGTVVLGVHISDVAAWVTAGSRFDQTARERGFSSYIPAMFRPMLPGALTSLISLRQGADSPAHSVLFTIRESTGRILSYRRVHSRICVNARLNYDEVQAFMDSPRNVPAEWDAELCKNLRRMITLTRKMRLQRKKHEMPLSIETSEMRVMLDPDSLEITGIRKEVSRESEQLIEECMLAANSAVASEMIERKIPGIYRVHDEPDPAKIEDFKRLMEYSFHIMTGDLTQRENCERFLLNLKNGLRKSVILSNFLRSLPRAVYDVKPSLHFGLGKYRYAHFTSPIRRYTDLLVHRQLWAADMGKELMTPNFMSEAADHCTGLEERNDNAYFAASDRLKLHYLHLQDDPDAEIPKIYEAMIAKVVQGGLLCAIEEIGLYGFVPAGKLQRGEVRYHKRTKRMKGERGHSQYKCGDILYAVLDSLDFVRGRAIFRPV